MIVKPLADFKEKRLGLQIPTRINIDELIMATTRLMPYLCELEAGTQTIEFNLPENITLRIIIEPKKSKLYVLFV